MPGGAAAAAAPGSSAAARGRPGALASLDRSEIRSKLKAAPQDGRSSSGAGAPYAPRRPHHERTALPVRYVLFGDSFVRLFGLVKHREIKLQAPACIGTYVRHARVCTYAYGHERAGVLCAVRVRLTCASAVWV